MFNIVITTHHRKPHNSHLRPVLLLLVVKALG